MATVTDRSPPTTIAIVIATSIIAALGGFFLGQASSLGVFGSQKRRSGGNRDKKQSTNDNIDSSDESDADEGADDSDEGQDDLQSFTSSNEECKLVLVVRTDLGMTKGKIAAQCSHATLACYKTLLNTPTMSSVLSRWERLGQAKIAVQAKSEEELQLLQAKALSLGVCARIIHDAGRTQIAAGSATVLGVGPAPKSAVDEITGGLKLL